MIIVSPRICQLLSVVVPIKAITLWPFIFCRQPLDPIAENHERIHLRQQIELLVLPAYLLHLVTWLWGLAWGLGADGAYMQIPLEREAYAHEEDLSYLSRRKPFAWIRRTGA